MIVSQMISKGWEVDVVTAGDRLTDNGERYEHIHRIGFSTPDKRFTSRPTPDRFSANLVKLKKIYRWFQWPDESNQWIKKGWDLAHDVLMKNKSDAFITVSWPFSTHLIGLKIKNEYNLPWLADIGDPFLLPLNHSHKGFNYFQKKSLKAEKQVLTRSDYVVVTTDQLKDVYSRFTGHGSERLAVIPPMLSPEPQHHGAIDTTDDLYRIGYFGSFYEQVRSPKLIQHFARQLQDISTSKNIVLLMHGHYKAPDRRQLVDLANEANIALQFRPWVPRERVREVMASMDLLLSIGNNVLRPGSK